MFCSVHVTYTTARGKVFRDRIAYNLLRADAEAVARGYATRGYESVTIEDYPAGPFTARFPVDWGMTEKNHCRHVAVVA